MTAAAAVASVAAVPALAARGVAKRFGHVEALRSVDLTVDSGELVALVGDNGAGKSTLVNVLSGALRPDAGEVLVDGRTVSLNSPSDARDVGIEAVHQTLALVPELDAAENLFLGRGLRRSGVMGRLGFVDRARMRREAEALFSRLGVVMSSVASPVSTLSGGQRQMVAVARAAAFTGRVVFLDEPTAALAAEPSRRVMELIDRTRASGVAIVLVSHDLTRVFEAADRIVVLRLGKVVGAVRPATSSMEEVVALMTGAKASRATEPADSIS